MKVVRNTCDKGSNFLGKGNFSRNGFKVLLLRYWFIHIFDIKNIKITFSRQTFNMTTVFTLTGSFIYFFYENLITLLVSKTLP